MTKVLSAAMSISTARLKFSTAWASPGPCPAADIAGVHMVRKVWWVRGFFSADSFMACSVVGVCCPPCRVINRPLGAVIVLNAGFGIITLFFCFC